MCLFTMKRLYVNGYTLRSVLKKRFSFSKDKETAAVKSSRSGSLCQRWVMDDLMVLCPVYCVYNVLADYFHSSGKEQHFLSAKRERDKKEREWDGEREREACRLTEERGRTSKGRDAKYTPRSIHIITFLALTCASLSLCVLHERKINHQCVTESVCCKVPDIQTFTSHRTGIRFDL